MKYAYNTASPDRYLLLKELAEKNRQHPTAAEAHLWTFLSGRQLGVKFNRQHVIGGYIADFVCLEKNLIIEIDGEYHYAREQAEADFDRTIALSRMGFHVIRFDNDRIMQHIDEVLDSIIDEIESL